MKYITMLALGILAVGMTSTQSNADEKKKEENKTENVIDHYWYPLFYEPINWFHSSEVHYRKNQEKAAADEIKKSISWLKFAASHALPNTKASLDDSATTLTKLANDLASGNSVKASKLSAELAKASVALARWHYFNADAKLAKSEEKDAAKHLQAAATYIKNAADSANYEYGDSFSVIYDDCCSEWIETDYEPGKLETNLSTVKKELNKLTKSLNEGGDSK